MRIDNYGNSWPSAWLEESFEKALKKVKKDGRVRYIFPNGSISLRVTKKERLNPDYWILSIDEYCHARKQWHKMKNPQF